MYPNNDPFNQQPSGIDYLNQIAAPPPAEGFDKKTKIILVIFGIIGILSLIFIFTMLQNTSSSASPLQVAARVQKLTTISQKYKDKLQDSRLQSTNSSLVSVMTTANTSIVEVLSNSGIDYNKQKKEIAQLDPSTKLETKFDDAALNAQLDVVYAHEMNVQITDTITMMQKLEKSTNSRSMKDYLAKTITYLDNIQKQLGDFIKTD